MARNGSISFPTTKKTTKITTNYIISTSSPAQPTAISLPALLKRTNGSSIQERTSDKKHMYTNIFVKNLKNLQENGITCRM